MNFSINPPAFDYNQTSLPRLKRSKEKSGQTDQPSSTRLTRSEELTHRDKQSKNDEELEIQFNPAIKPFSSNPEIFKIPSLPESAPKFEETIPYARWISTLKTKNSASFNDRLQGLKALCNISDSTPIFWRNKITFNPGDLPNLKNPFNLNVEIVKDTYASNAIAQNTYESQVPQGKSPLYNYIRIFEGKDQSSPKNNDWFHPLILLRVDMEGEVAEIVYLKKGIHLSGNDVKKLLCGPLLDYLSIKKVIKHDDSTRVIERAKKVEILLRALLPIVSKEGTPEEGLTWYAKDGFTPMSCKQLQYATSSLLVSQDPNFYFAAVEKIRKTSIGHLFDNVCNTVKNQQKVLLTLTEKYFPESAKLEGEQKKLFLTSLTVAKLGEAVFSNASNKSLKANEAEKANQDLASFYSTCLQLRPIDSKSSQAALIHNVALDIMQSHIYWIKSFQDPAQNISYAQFKGLPHKSFDDLIANYTVTHKTSWQGMCKGETTGPAVEIAQDPLSRTVGVTQLNTEEFLNGLKAPGSIACGMSTTSAAFKTLCSLASLSTYEDSISKKYWQLWIEVAAPGKNVKGYLELTITPKENSPDTYIIEVNRYPTEKTLLEIEVGPNKANILFEEEISPSRASTNPQIIQVINGIKSLLI